MPIYWILGQTLMYIISSICLYADATYRFEDFVVVITELSLINDSSVLGGDEIAQSSRGTAYKNKYDNSLPYVEMVIGYGTRFPKLASKKGFIFRHYYFFP